LSRKNNLQIIFICCGYVNHLKTMSNRTRFDANFNACNTATLNVHGVDNTVYTYVCASGTLASGGSSTVSLNPPATLTKPGLYAVEYVLTDSATAPTTTSIIEHLVYINNQAGTLEVVPCAQSTGVDFAGVAFASKTGGGLGVTPVGPTNGPTVVNATLRKL
jgi:hypothetical protein